MYYTAQLSTKPHLATSLLRVLIIILIILQRPALLVALCSCRSCGCRLFLLLAFLLGSCSCSRLFCALLPPLLDTLAPLFHLSIKCTLQALDRAQQTAETQAYNMNPKGC